ncbi:MAG TPA: NAD(P)H-quinone oxidoreductase [Casimicrobiaceae bacterium]|nr:NAD(P)H-quinone oxidoreductase [Casimicrobiaceae bacterium]
MTLPSTMRQIAVRAPGGADQLAIADAPLPSLNPGEVLVEVAWAGVNRPDIAQRAGHYPPPPDASPILGLEVSGTIAACAPDVAQWQVGDRVCSLVAGGGYAEYCTAPAAWCMRIPAPLTLEQAAGVPENYFTVWNNVFDRAALKSGESILVHGGSSGIGLAAIQLAKAFGATVLTTAGSAAKVAFCRDIGAEHAIDYKTQDFVAEVARITAKRGVDVVLDMVGGDYIEKNLKVLANDGRLVLIAFQKGSRVECDWVSIMAKRLTVTGSTMRRSPFARKVALAQELQQDVWPLFGAGKLKVVVDSTFKLADAAAAHRRMETSQHIGKILLEVRG